MSDPEKENESDLSREKLLDKIKILEDRLLQKEELIGILKEYNQKFINDGLKEMGLSHLKSICFNPNENVTRNHVRTRSGAPTFLTSITTVKSLDVAHFKIRGTKYWKNNRK